MKSICLFQLQALGPCTSHLEVCRPLLSVSCLPAGQSCQDPAPGFTHKSLAGCVSEMSSSVTNPLPVLTETLPNEQRGRRDVAGVTTPARTPPWQGKRRGVLSQANTTQWVMSPSRGLFRNKTHLLILREFSIWNSILFLNWNTFPSPLSSCTHLPQR